MGERHTNVFSHSLSLSLCLSRMFVCKIGWFCAARAVKWLKLSNFITPLVDAPIVSQKKHTQTNHFKCREKYSRHQPLRTRSLRSNKSNVLWLCFSFPSSSSEFLLLLCSVSSRFAYGLIWRCDALKAMTAQHSGDKVRLCGLTVCLCFFLLLKTLKVNKQIRFYFYFQECMLKADSPWLNRPSFTVTQRSIFTTVITVWICLFVLGFMFCMSLAQIIESHTYLHIRAINRNANVPCYAFNSDNAKVCINSLSLW